MAEKKNLAKMTSNNKDEKTSVSSPDTLSKTSLHKFFRSYVEAGFFMTPLHGKEPYKRGWQNSLLPPTAENFPLNQNFGIVLTDEDLVIDVDPRHFPEGDNPLIRLIKIIGKIEAYTVATGGNGLHIYLKKPAQLAIKRSLREFKGLEFKSKGQQVVGCGCIHPETNKKYSLKFKYAGYKCEAPQALLDLLDAKQDPSYYLKGAEDYLLDEDTIDSYKKYLVSDAPCAVEGVNGDLTTFTVACKGKDLGLDPQTTFDLMASLWNSACTPPWDLDALRTKVENGFKYSKSPLGNANPLIDFKDILPPPPPTKKLKGILKENWQINKSGIKLKTLTNVVNFFLEKDSPLLDLLRFNDFSKEIEFNKGAVWHSTIIPPAWSDTDAVSCKYWLSSVKNFEVGISLIHEAALILAKANYYHPIRDYLENLIWDKNPRLDGWLTTYAKVKPTKFSIAVGSKTLIASVKRIYEAGCKFDHILILEGKTGTRKSTLCEVLGGDFYGELHIDASNTQDLVENMRGKWVLELPELVMSRRSDTNSMKAFLSRRIDRTRLAYARTAENFPRQSILIGTHNPDGHGYLQDTTGNRRYWMVEVKGIIDIDFLIRDRDQLFAEAVFRYKQKEDIYLKDKEVLKEALANQKAREIRDMWVEPVSNWLIREKKKVVTLMEVYEGSLDGAPRTFTPKEQRRLSVVMKMVGWEKGVYIHPDHGKQRVSAFRKKYSMLNKYDF